MSSQGYSTLCYGVKVPYTEDESILKNCLTELELVPTGLYFDEQVLTISESISRGDTDDNELVEIDAIEVKQEDVLNLKSFCTEHDFEFKPKWFLITIQS